MGGRGSRILRPPPSSPTSSIFSPEGCLETQFGVRFW
nr:MAG TPA: hypothetical protein [Caudoviricetes sp.]